MPPVTVMSGALASGNRQPAPFGARACRLLAFAALGFALPVVMVIADKSAPVIFGTAALCANLAVILDGRRAELAWRYITLLTRPALWAVVAVLLLALASMAWTIDITITRRGLIEAAPELISALAAAAAFPLIATAREARWLIAGLLVAGGLILFERMLGLPLHQLVGARAAAWDLKRASTPPVLLLWPVLGYVLARRLWWLALLLALVAGAGAVAAHSIGPAVALAVAGGLFVLARWVPRATLSLSIIVLLTLLAAAPWTGTLVSRLLPAAWETALADEHASQRIIIWTAFESRLPDRPLLGYGFNASFRVAATTRPDGQLMADAAVIRDAHPHNILLQIWVEFGVAGALLAAALLLVLALRLYRSGAVDMAPRLALLVTIVGIGLVGISAWQPWWLAAIAAALLWFELVREPERVQGS